MSTTALLVRKDQINQTRLRTTPQQPLLQGQVRVRIESFALTANNITYAAFGDAMSYWQFWPSGEDAWGIVPVWGFATVVHSLYPGVALGERLYGYWPMADTAVLLPSRLSESGFREGSAHRAHLHAVYNHVLRCNQDPFYTPGTEAMQALLRPLFTTSWLIDDFFADNHFFGARVMLLSSASSKTAYGTAFQLAQRTGIDVVGLTSTGNQAFCQGLGCYERVLTYDQLDQVSADIACAYVDFAGNAKLRRHIHTRFAGLTYNCSIGGTHVDQLRGTRELPGPRPVLFFAPAQIKKCSVDWGADLLGQRLVQAWQAFLARVGDHHNPWLKVQMHQGPSAVQAAYSQILAGQCDPQIGHVMTFH
jgi:Protein of unknown function (DUF2855)